MGDGPHDKVMQLAECSSSYFLVTLSKPTDNRTAEKREGELNSCIYGELKDYNS